ncbi:TorF family putative porin [Acinetobacter baumannii]|uniref:TorF family putative porin n=1 Tax=Acinetobacter baumannii TaxID=470 RepID=UPI00293FCEAF|nr:TorF family putative porin [Acinetobacter baumannii]MDV4291776.1 TorF family putative porin [Acinetobacter baumannii]
MRKILGVASLIMSTGVVHAEQLNEQEQISPYSANVTFASQYISRGFQQTWGKPALQIGLDYANPNGLFVGTWASNVSSNYLRDASVEWDFYAGYLKTIDKFSIGMSVFYYYYPGAKSTPETGSTSYNYGEIVPQIGYGPLSLKYFITYTPDYAGYNSNTMGGTEGKRSRGTTYLDLNFTQPINESWTFGAHYGYERIKNFSEANFQDMKVELIKDLGDGWTTGLAYTKAWDKDGYYRNYSNGEPDAPISNPIDSIFTVSVKKVF